MNVKQKALYKVCLSKLKQGYEYYVKGQDFEVLISVLSKIKTSYKCVPYTYMYYKDMNDDGKSCVGVSTERYSVYMRYYIENMVRNIERGNNKSRKIKREFNTIMEDSEGYLIYSANNIMTFNLLMRMFFFSKVEWDQINMYMSTLNSEMLLQLKRSMQATFLYVIVVLYVWNEINTKDMLDVELLNILMCSTAEQVLLEVVSKTGIKRSRNILKE